MRVVGPIGAFPDPRGRKRAWDSGLAGCARNTRMLWGIMCQGCIGRWGVAPPVCPLCVGGRPPPPRRGDHHLQRVGRGNRDALEAKGPQEQRQKRSDRRLQVVAKAVGGVYCRLRMPLKQGLVATGTVAGHRQRPWGRVDPFWKRHGLGAGGFTQPLPSDLRSVCPCQRAPRHFRGGGPPVGLCARWTVSTAQSLGYAPRRSWARSAEATHL